MGERFFRLVELVFTAYAVPALLIPAVWLGRRALRSLRGPRALESEDRLTRVVALYGTLSAVWFAAWLALALGAPLERAGTAGALLLWTAYGLLNLALATLLVRFTSGYGGLPDGRPKDRLFLCLLSAVLIQPFATAGAFMVLYRVMGVLYRLRVPGLTAVQEGI